LRYRKAEQVLNHAHPELHAEYVVFSNTSRQYVDCSEGVCRLLGYERAELLEKKIDDVSYNHAEVPRLFAQYLQRKTQEGEYVLRHRNGLPVPIRYRAFVFPDGCHAAIWEPIRDWRETYLAALLETDRAKLGSRIEVAFAAIQARTQEADYKDARQAGERQAVADALSALQSLRRELQEQPGRPNV
jgi:PAS domain-containing protein